MPYTLIPLMFFLSSTVALGNAFVNASESCSASVFQETQNPETVSVVGSGSGLTVETAKQDALRDVVEKAVGLLVDAKTILENDKLIESVLTYSGAYVESYNQLEVQLSQPVTQLTGMQANASGNAYSFVWVPPFAPIGRTVYWQAVEVAPGGAAYRPSIALTTVIQ